MRVSNVELFFELVFVFAITQLTLLVDDAHEPFDFLRTLLVLILIWWMYAGYVWLTNVTGVDARMRLVLIAAMGGFLVLGAAVPQVYGADGLAFGLAYLYIVSLHLVAFRVQGGKEVSRAVLGLAPFNLGAAGLVILAGLVDVEWEWLLFVAAVAPFILATLSRRERGFPMNPGHFVDRHAGVMIIALGETVAGIGNGAAGHPLDAPTVAATGLSLAFIAAIWWVYFNRDHERAERALESASADARAAMAVRAYWYPFIAMLFGVVLVATGVQHMVAFTAEPAGDAAWLIAFGMAFYLMGSALFRRLVGTRKVASRVGAAAVAVVLGGLGAPLPSLVWLACAAGLALVLIFVEEKLESSAAQGP
jgi:low temperature requirement protein LtrA